MRSNLIFNLWDNISNPHSPVIYQVGQSTGNAPTLIKTKFFTNLGDTLVQGTRSPLVKREHPVLLQKEGWSREARSV